MLSFMDVASFKVYHEVNKSKMKPLKGCLQLVVMMFLNYSQQMFSIAHPYMASEAIQGTMPGQLSLYANQMVQVRLTFW